MESHPITPHIGTRLSGIESGQLMQPEILSSIKKELDNHLVVIIPGQSLSASELREFVSSFGPLFIHHDDEGVILADGLPEVLEMRKEPDGERLFGGSDWHADVTFRNPAGYMSALHARVLPPLGGDTGFASTIAAYEALSDGLKHWLENLHGVHSYDGPGRPDHPTETAVHPVVRTHSASGRKGIYANKMFATRFVGMSEDESRPIINYIDRHASKPEFSFRLRWSEGDLVLWDNRFTLHYPINDFTGHARLLIRCTAMEGSYN